MKRYCPECEEETECYVEYYKKDYGIICSECLIEIKNKDMVRR